MKRLFLIGAPRSGTTWVAKVFDAHPDVIYRHEPDSALSNSHIPAHVPEEDLSAYIDDARAYVDRLFTVSNLKTNSARPWFPKSYRSPGASLLRNTIVTALRGAERVPALKPWAQTRNVPDFLSKRPPTVPFYVAKSVIGGGRAGLYARACTDIRFLLIVRHPCGFVASQLRGAELGLMRAQWPINAMTNTCSARRRGVQNADFKRMDSCRLAAWYWLIFNEAMLETTRGLSNCALFDYDRACSDPTRHFRAAYAHAGIPMTEAVSTFLQASDKPTAMKSSVTGIRRALNRHAYFSVSRNTKEAPQRWRSDLSAAQIAAVADVVGDSPVLDGLGFSFELASQ